MSEVFFRLRSVKYDDGEIEIAGHEEHQATSDKKEIVLRSTEEPRPEFLAPFKDLVFEVRKLIDVPPNWCAGELVVKKVVWSYSEKTGVSGATICCQAKLDCADAPLVFNTPHLPFEQYSDGGNAPLMPKGIVALLEALEVEARAFLAGSRAQGNLFEDAA